MIFLNFPKKKTTALDKIFIQNVPYSPNATPDRHIIRPDLTKWFDLKLVLKNSHHIRNNKNCETGIYHYCI